MKSTFVSSAQAQERWVIYDASEHTLGRMASKIAMQLMGKDRPTYTANQLTGAHVVVIHAEKARTTGVKAETKTYAHYTGYAGGRKDVAMERVRAVRPEDLVWLAVRRMLPKTKLGHDMLRRLKVYKGAEHPHTAQKPVKQAPTAK